MNCHQRVMREQLLENDLKTLNFDPSSLKASDFALANETYSPEITEFIKTYEWLQSFGVSPKWTFTARYKGILSGVILINEPVSYSTILGPDTRKYEALIQRGAVISWAPKNLNSRLLMYACKWMVNNTAKRIFNGYSDPDAGEVGQIYQACNFDYLGKKFGNKVQLVHPAFKKGKPFSAQTLRRTSTLKKWCKENSISIEPEWIKINGFKDLSKIPSEVKTAWYQWGKQVIKDSEKIKLPPKGKYAMVLGKDKREQRLLDSLKTYKPCPYIKRVQIES